MSYSDIARLLRHLRKEAKITLKEAEKQAKERGVQISFKTISGYEKGRSIPNADIFLVLCDIYGSKDPVMDLKKLKNEVIEESTLKISSSEEKYLEMYRELDSHGKKTVDTVLALERERLNKEHKQKVSKNVKVGAEFDKSILIAARGSEGMDEEQKRLMDEDAMDLLNLGEDNDEI